MGLRHNFLANCVFIAEAEPCVHRVPCQQLFGSSGGHVHGSQLCPWFVVNRR